GLGHVAVAGRRPAHRARIPRRMLAVVAPPVALVAAAGVPVAGAGRAARLLRVRRAVGPGPGTVLGEVALAGGGAADDARGLEAVRGTRGARAVAGLGHVAVARGRPAHRTGIPRGVLAVVAAAVAGVGRARVAVIGAGGARGVLCVGRAVGAGPGTALGEVALAGGSAADDARGLEAVGGTAVAGAVAGLDRVAGTSRGAADRAGRALGIRGARRADARACLGHVAVPGGRAAHRAPIPCRMLAVIASAVALVAAARIAIVGARGTRGALRVGRTRGARSRAQLCGIALAGRGAAERRGGEEGVGGTGGTRAVAGLGRVAGAGRGAAERRGRALGVGGARGAGAVAGLGRVAVSRRRPRSSARIPCRMLAVIAAAVALVAAARIAIVGAGGPAGLL